MRALVPVVPVLCFVVSALGIVAPAAPPQFVGVWQSPIDSLPDQRLPHVPLLGNGHVGVAMNTVPSPGNGADIGPGRANTVDLWHGSNAMWRCLNCTGFAPGCCSLVSLGGVSISLLPTFDAQVALSFRAEQRIGPGHLYSRWTTAAGSTFETLTYMDWMENIVVTNCTWRPGGDDPQSITIDVGTWTLTGGSTGEGPQPATVGCASAKPPKDGQPVPGPCSAPGPQFTFVSRKAVGDSEPAPYARVWAALATAVTGGTVVGYSNATSKGAWQATARVSVPAGTVVSVMTVENENWFGGSTDPSAFALFMLLLAEESGGAAWVDQLSAQGWESFWAQSSVSFPSRPDVEQFWYGAQYILACAASTDASIPAPGLYGPWVTTDDPDWHGDYTLDYNQEATFYGAFGSNHVDQTSSYYGPILDWWTSAADMAQSEAAEARVNCSATALHFPCHLAPWGMQSQDQTVYMHWNGPFAAGLFINHYEYTLNSSFAQYYTYPLLDGFNAWWHCYLQRTQTGPGADDYVYEDINQYNPDAQHEGQLVPNPQIALSFIKRTMESQLQLAAALGLTPPPYLQDIVDHLAPFNTAQANFTVATFTIRNDTGCGRTAADATRYVLSAPDCQVLCARDPACAMFSFAPAWAHPSGTPQQPTCTTYAAGDFGRCNAIPGFVAGLRGAANLTATVWTSYKAATVADSDMFAQYPNFPSESLTNGTSPDVRRIAQASSRLYSDFANGRPVNLFPNAVRSGADPSNPLAWTPAEVLDGLEAYLANYFGPNLLPYAPGGGIENVGVTRAVNEMLVQTPTNSYIALFPMWPADEPASFYQLLVKGGFLVSSVYDNVTSSVTDLEVTAAYSQFDGVRSCTVLSPWPTADRNRIQVTCGGNNAPIQWDKTGTLFTFSAPFGTLCKIAITRAGSPRV